MNKTLLFSLMLSLTGYAHSSPLVFVGDSLADGYKRSSHGNGITKVGASPKAVAGMIDRSNLKQQTVVLSTGISNNCQDIKQAQYNILRVSNEASTFLLIGTMNCPAKVQDQIIKLCSSLENCYFHELDKSKSRDGIHPSIYLPMRPVSYL